MATRRMILLIMTWSLNGFAANSGREKYWVPGEGSRVDIKIGYTFGTHTLSSSDVRGKFKRSDSDVTGELSVAIRSIKEGSAKLECHLQEALGLNYEVSDFPEEHVCSDAHTLPETGSNAVVYPDIRLQVDKIEKSEGRIQLLGTWTIHGKTQPAKVDLVVSEETPDSFSAIGESQFRLEDYGIVVKKAFVVSVSDTAKIAFTMKFKKE